MFLPTPGDGSSRASPTRGKATSRAASRCPSTSGASLLRVFAAFLLACVTAIPAGIAMGVSRIARGIFDPPIEFYRPLPPLAYLPLIVIWFGIDETAKVILIYLACFAPLAMAARAGVQQRDDRADQRRVFDGRVEVAGDLARRDSRGDAGDPHRHAHRDRLRLDDARRRRDGRGHGGPRPDGAERVELPAHRRRDHGHRRDRRRRLPVRPPDALRRARWSCRGRARSSGPWLRCPRWG